MAIKETLTSLSLEGKTALVTGGGTGIGKSIALEFAKAGANLAVSGRRPAPLIDVVKEIKDLGREAIAVPTDVAQKTEVEALISQVNNELGGIDILVNNAANGGSGPSLLDSDEDRWDEIIDTNLKSVYLCCHAVGQTMINRGSGNIINISSIASLRASEGARILSLIHI